MEYSPEHNLEQALAEAIRSYFSNCRQRIPEFVANHFKYPGTWHTNKHALGWDLVRAPLNLFWAPTYLCIQLTALLLRKLGCMRLGNWLRLTPSGFTTDIQRYLTQQTFSQLLGRHEIAEQDALFLSLRNSILIETDINDELALSKRSAINAIVNDALEQYRITRTASADIGNSLVSVIIGGFAFKKFTPGGIAIGLALSSWLAHQLAVDNFIFGTWLGGFYYPLFPPQPSLGLSVLSVGGVLSILSVFASFSGLITDPIQRWTGLHQQRLRKMIDKLEQDFLEDRVGGFRPKDQFLARVLEVIDMLKTSI